MSTRTMITLLLTAALSAPSVAMMLNSQMVLEEAVKRILIALAFSVIAISIVNSVALPSPESRRQARLEAQALELETKDTFEDSSAQAAYDDPFAAGDPFGMPGMPADPSASGQGS